MGEKIEALKEMGFRECSVDDFSSFIILRDFDIDSIKIEDELILDKNRDIIKSIIQLANKLNTKVVSKRR